MGGIPAGQGQVRRRHQAALLFLLLALPALGGVDPRVYLERQVLIPFRLWDTTHQEYMTDLSRIRLEDFRIREDRREQVALAVDLERRPLSLVLAVDISGSMEKSLPSVRQAARRLGERLKPPDRVAVLSFNREVVLASDPSADRGELRRSLAGLHSWGFTAVYDAIHEGLEILEHEPDPRAIIVLTDGGDNRSSWSIQDVADQAREAHIPLFFICHKVDPSGFADLLEAADETGGRVFRSSRDQDFLRIFGTIAEGLRNTFVVAYRPDRPWDDPAWRGLELRYGTRNFKVDTAKTGYYPGPSPANEPGAQRLSPTAAANGLSEPYPDVMCPRNDHCEQPLQVTLEPGRPSRMTIRGWIDVGHDMGAMVHPGRYGESRPLPEDPRRIDLRYWAFQRRPFRPDRIHLLLPAPRDLPRSPGRFWETVLSTGAVFRTTGMEQVQFAEFRPAVLETTIPAIPGLTGGRATAPPRTLWWTDGRITHGFREIFSRWIFSLMPRYSRWVKQRYDEGTAAAVRDQVEATLARVEENLPDELRDRIAAMVAEEVRIMRGRRWEPVATGKVGPTDHLLPRRADIQAADWLERADALLVDRLLAGPVPEPQALEELWLVPARETWSRLRTFFSPLGHQSLTPGMPFLDETRGEIYLQRVILPWVESRRGVRHFGRFPAGEPAGLLAVADLLQDRALGPLLAGGRYRCSESGVSVIPGFSRDAEQRPAEWNLKVETLQAEKERLREIRRKLEPEDGVFIQREEQVLDRQLRSLRRPAGTRTELVLDRAGEEGIGIRLVREGDLPMRATPLADPGLVLETTDPAALVDLAALAAGNGAEPDNPALANALLASRINGVDGPVLAELLGADGPAACLGEGAGRKFRLRWRGAAPERVSPVRWLQEPDGAVLEVDLAGTTAGRLQDAMAGLCRPGDD